MNEFRTNHFEGKSKQNRLERPNGFGFQDYSIQSKKKSSEKVLKMI